MGQAAAGDSYAWSPGCALQPLCRCGTPLWQGAAVATAEGHLCVGVPQCNRLPADECVVAS